MPFQTLPVWVQLGAFFLAFNAGMMNALGLLSIWHQTVSHMTGNVSMLAIAILHGQSMQAIYGICVITSFVLGSLYSGYILGSSHFQLGRRYGIPLSLSALCIFLCWLLIPYYPRYALLWACVAMGMQNAMVSHYKGAIIRTTHLTGLLTDLGLNLGYLLRGLPVERRRVVLLIVILMGFLFGGIVVTWLYPYLNLHTFLIPVCLSLAMSLTYWTLYIRNQLHH
ncbi:YoaK family protein [Acinetobacter brisouii]|uniref:YoaK family protein n=1 Tax=Acinetobacter brisouii TaxID=396323 RepID=UPI00124E8A15|nr:YoaK family protein [Acinetobacter brisouii]